MLQQLLVDFFFILSGFVIGYAYDDRWGKSLTMKDFFKRRLIRLHPMVIMGAVLGAITFCIQGSVQWDGTHIGISMIMLSLLCTIFFIPAMPGVGYEVRGNGEMFPLNGPCWSLFFEYIGNILYALAGCCPRNDQSNQKIKSTRISRAGSYFKPVLVQVANALIKSKKHPEFTTRYKRIKARRGHKKAIIAICRMILTAIWHILSDLEPYTPEGFLESRPVKEEKVLSTSQALNLLKQRGYIIKDEPLAVSKD